MAKHKRANRPPAQKKPPLTHFLCLPLVTPTSKPQLEVSLAKFKDAVTNGSSTDSVEGASKDDDAQDGKTLPPVHPKAIRPVGALHCTLGVMSLKQQELKEAADFLIGLDVRSLIAGEPHQYLQEERGGAIAQKSSEPASLQRPITPPQAERSAEPLSVDLKGLESMHAPSNTSILYVAPSDASDRLYTFCLALQKVFKDKGLLVEDNRALKLHATVVNTIYAKGRKRSQRGKIDPQSSSSTQSRPSSTAPGAGHDDRSSGHGPNANAPLKIDSTQLLEQYKDYVWAANVVLDRVAICEMGAKKIFDEQGNVKAEEYTEITSVALPT